MKRLYLSLLLCSSLFLSSCDTLKQVASQLGISEFEMAAGLKDALSQGLFRGFDAFANLPHYPFPGGRSLRIPFTAMGAAYYSLRDRLGV